MNKGYNLDNLEALFRKYLIAGIEKADVDVKTNVLNNKNSLNKASRISHQKSLKKTSVKNYLSDLRHFLGWLIFYLQSHNYKLSQTSLKDQLDNEIEVLKNIDLKIVEAYKTYLEENRLPIKTINRRLSTLRKFFSFCLSQGWLKENPAKEIRNLSAKTKDKKLSSEKEKILTQFKTDLLKENLFQEDVNSYLKDIEEFFNLI